MNSESRSWEVRIRKPAQKSILRAPRNERERLLRVLEEEMTRDPFSGDVIPLTNERAAFRRRVGDWRIFFDVDRDRTLVEVTNIECRSSTTYRKRK